MNKSFDFLFKKNKVGSVSEKDNWIHFEKYKDVLCEISEIDEKCNLGRVITRIKNQENPCSEQFLRVLKIKDEPDSLIFIDFLNKIQPRLEKLDLINDSHIIALKENVLDYKNGFQHWQIAPSYPKSNAITLTEKYLIDSISSGLNYEGFGILESLLPFFESYENLIGVLFDPICAAFLTVKVFFVFSGFLHKGGNYLSIIKKALILKRESFAKISEVPHNRLNLFKYFGFGTVFVASYFSWLKFNSPPENILKFSGKTGILVRAIKENGGAVVHNFFDIVSHFRTIAITSSLKPFVECFKEIISNIRK